MNSPAPTDFGIWAIWYNLDDAQRTEYERWFHHVHTAEKLSRPNYSWAAHYPLEANRGYLALFGGECAHTFLSPSPAQLAPRQSAETRRFIQMSLEPSFCVLAEEARVVDRTPPCRRGGYIGSRDPVRQLHRRKFRRRG